MIPISSQFSWDKSVEQRIKNAAKRASLSIGIKKDAKYPSGEKVEDVALSQEFGDGNIPPRPFMRETIANHKDEWGEELARKFKKVIKGKGSAKTVFKAFGNNVKDEVVAAIKEKESPPLHKKTIERKSAKGRENPGKPLIDSGLLMDSISVEVVSE